MEGHVALMTFTVLSFRLLFYSTRELSVTAMLFCCACSLCVGQLVALAIGNSSPMGMSGIFTVPSYLAWIVKFACNHSILSQQARLACCTYTSWFVPEENCSE
jgi:uncharacterized membrane protein